MINRFRTSVLFVLILIMITIVPLVHAASDVPYSFSPTGSTCSVGDFDAANGNGLNSNTGFGEIGSPSPEGVKDTDFNSFTLSTIKINLCAVTFSVANGTTDSNIVNIGVFSSSGAAIAIFGTIGYNSLPLWSETAGDNKNPASALITVTGSHQMANGEIIGISFSSANNEHSIVDICGSPCAGTELKHGGILLVGCSNCVFSSGFSQAGTLSLQLGPFTNFSNTFSTFLPLFGLLDAIIFISVYTNRFNLPEDVSNKLLAITIVIGILVIVIGLGITQVG